MIPLSAAHAGEIKPFAAQTFAALQGAGKRVVVDVYADWCPTCRRQAPIASELAASPEFSDYTVLKVDFVTQKDVRRAFRVGQQSMLIVFRGTKEVARTIGDADRGSIAVSWRKAAS
jgi:thioredoxin 1